MAAVLSGCISHVRALCFFMGVLSLSASWGWADSCLLAFYTFSSESDTPIELYSPVKLVPFQEYRPELGAEFSKHELEIQGEVVYEILARDGGGWFYRDRDVRNRDYHALLHGRISRESPFCFRSDLQTDPPETLKTARLSEVLLTTAVFARDYSEVKMLRNEHRMKRARETNGEVPQRRLSWYQYLWRDFVDMKSVGLSQFVKNTVSQYGSDGSPVQVSFGPRKAVLISDPADLAEMLSNPDIQSRLSKGFSVQFISQLLLNSGMAVQENGDRYDKLHQLIVPYFTGLEMRGHFSQMYQHSQHQIERLKSFAKNEPGRAIDIEREMLKFAMGGICGTMLNYDLTEERAEELSDALSSVLSFVHQCNMNYPLSLLTQYLPTWMSQSCRDYVQAMKKIRNFVEELIQHDRQFEDRGEGAGTLIRAFRQANQKHLSPTKDSLKLNDQELMDQVVSVFFGGHETTAHLLTMTIYRIFQNPEVYEKLFAELDSALLADVTKLRYMDAVINEVLRVDSSIPLFARDVMEDIEVRGYRISRGTLVIFSLDSTHRLKEFWKDPEKFDPDRFMPETQDIHQECGRRHPRAFSPFGVGDRSCIGKIFAKQEAKVFLANLLMSGLKFQICPETQVETHLVCTARMVHGLWMIPFLTNDLQKTDHRSAVFPPAQGPCSLVRSEPLETSQQTACSSAVRAEARLRF